LLGFACRLHKFHARAVLSVAVGTAALALSHNIFLLHNALRCTILAASLSLFPAVSAGTTPLSRRLTPPLVLGTGIALGLAVTAWQWLPAALTLEEISFQYIGAFGECIQPPDCFPPTPCKPLSSPAPPVSSAPTSSIVSSPTACA
jgi:hypothetical protein